MAALLRRLTVGLSSAQKAKSLFPMSAAVRKMAHTTDKLVVTEKLGKIFMIGINRPEVRNCVNQATAQELLDAFDQFESDNDLWVAIFHGKGGNFCAGYDLSELAAKNSSDIPAINEMQKGRGPMGPSRILFTKPVIAAVTGYAVAGGLELSLIADLRIAEENTIFGVFCRRFGVPLLDGGTVRLPQLIGLSRALDMVLSGRPVPAQEALQMGLANRVVPTGAALGEAVKLAQTLCSFPQECMRKDRQSAYYSCFGATSMDDAFRYEHDNGKVVIENESVKGAQRFVGGVGRSGSFNLDGKSKI